MSVFIDIRAFEGPPTPKYRMEDPRYPLSKLYNAHRRLASFRTKPDTWTFYHDGRIYTRDHAIEILRKQIFAAWCYPSDIEKDRQV